jgi:hypothetical protein
MPHPMSMACCRLSSATTSPRLPSVWASPGYRCKASWAGRRGTMSPGDRRCAVKARRPGDQEMACGGAIPLGFPPRVASPWGGPVSGVVAWAQWTPARGPCTGDTSRARAPPWWTPACPCPQHGRRPRPVSPKRACRKGPEATAGVTSWPGRGWHKTAPVCPIAGVLVMPRGGAALLVSASPGGRGGAVWVGGAVAHAETCSGGRAPRVERPGTSVQASLAPGRGVESIACGGALAQDRGARWVQRPSGG